MNWYARFPMIVYARRKVMIFLVRYLDLPVYIRQNRNQIVVSR